MLHRGRVEPLGGRLRAQGLDCRFCGSGVGIWALGEAWDDGCESLVVASARGLKPQTLRPRTVIGKPCLRNQAPRNSSFWEHLKSYGSMKSP